MLQVMRNVVYRMEEGKIRDWELELYFILVQASDAYVTLRCCRKTDKVYIQYSVTIDCMYNELPR